MINTINVTIWNEFRQEKVNEEAKKLYPLGIHKAISEFLSVYDGIETRTATLDENEHGLTESVLNETDVLIWWGHLAHEEVSEVVVERIQQRILAGMGLIVLHSGHYSKIFRRMLGTNCSLRWREIAEKERLWNIEPGHPITAGIGDYIELPFTEMYGERFDIPTPDKLIFVSWFEGGEVFRSGCCWERGHGRIFYFRPGHETYPIFHNNDIRKIITNAVRWAQPRINQKTAEGPHVINPIETVKKKPLNFAGILKNSSNLNQES